MASTAIATSVSPSVDAFDPQDQRKRARKTVVRMNRESDLPRAL
jgi:hypothetical protein